MHQNKIHPIFFNCLAFSMAFCSICYELLIASKLSRTLGEGMFIFPICIAVFILSMGIGASLWNEKNLTSPKEYLKALLSIEIGLTLLGFLSIFSINILLENSLYGINLEAILIGLFLSFAIGFFSGQELPLLFHFCENLNIKQTQIRRIIFFDYCASFFASLACTLLFFAILGFFKTSILISFLNALIILSIIFSSKTFGINRSRYAFINTFIILGFYFFVFLNLNQFENILIKRSFMGSHPVRLLEKKYTRYQQILLFLSRKDAKPIKRSNKEALKHPKDYYFFMTLNGSLQFFEPFDLGKDPDHIYLFDQYLYFNQNLKNILILGGGDGLPARQALRYPSLEKITMVDLDKQWVEFAKQNPFMQHLNQNALNNKRINIHFADAFKWIIQTKEKFNLIIVDFPAEPGSLAKKRTTSIQFLRDLYRILNDDGIVIIHSNGISKRLKLKLFSKTATTAGFFPLFAFKENSSTWSAIEQLVLFKNKSEQTNFLNNYYNHYLNSPQFKKIPYDFGRLDYSLVPESKHIISFYDPFISALPFKDKWKLIEEEFD